MEEGLGNNLMNYDDIPQHLIPFIAVPRERYESMEGDLRDIMLIQARRFYEMTEMRITTCATDPPQLREDQWYVHEIFPSVMSIISHEYTLRKNIEPPNRTEFIHHVSRVVKQLSSSTDHQVKNVTFMYHSEQGLIFWLSFSRSNIESMGLDQLLSHMITGAEEWDESFFGGSDYIRQTFDRLLLSVEKFKVTTQMIQGGYGEVEYDYYRCINIPDNNNNDCLVKCFQYLSNNYHITPYAVRNIIGISNNEMLTIQHIPMLEDIYDINVCVYEDKRILDFRYKQGKHYYDHQAIIKRDYPVVLYGSLNTPHKILWKDNHFSVIMEEYMAKDCHCEHTGIFIGHTQSLTKDQIISELQKQGRIDTDLTTIGDEEDRDIFFYFFDYETVYRPDTMELIPYAWAIAKYNEQGEQLQIWDDITSDPQGRMSSIIDVIKRESPGINERKYFIGFNNSRFDNFLLLKECQASDVNVSNVFFAGNTILSMNMKGFIVRDLCRILCTSLEKACQGFRCELSKKELKHNEIQDQYLRNEPFDESTIRDYVVRDCTALGELFFKCRREFKRLISMDIEKYNTIASMSYRSFRNVAPIENNEYPILDTTLNQFVRKSIYGGRSQIFLSCEITSPLAVIDCTSLYPYVMISRSFPIGQPEFTTHYRPNKIGIYQCKILDQPRRTIIPFREPYQPLNWEYQGAFDCVLNSVDIESILRHDGKVEISFGYYWKEDRDDLFEYYFRTLIHEKKQQDAWKEAKDFRYNAAAREDCKLGMNAVSGKLQQRVFDELTTIIKNFNDLSAFHKKIICDTERFVSFGSWYIAQGKLANTRPKMPTIWGSLILSYARAYMYDNVLSQIPFIYGTDTDSAFIYRENIPSSLLGNNIGEFKEELRDAIHDGEEGPFGIFIAPKCYCFYKRVGNNEIIIKSAFKGVNLQKDVVVNSPDELPNDGVGLHRHYWDEKAKHICVSTFRTLLEGVVYILCSSLERRVSDFSANTMNIKQRFMLKEISKGNIEGKDVEI